MRIFVSVMEVILTAKLILCEEKNPDLGLILPLLSKLLHHFERKEGDSVFVLSLKNAIGQNLSTRYTDDNLRMFLEESSALDLRTKSKPCFRTETWEILVDKLSLIDFDIKTIKSESGLRSGNTQPVNSLPPCSDLPALPFFPGDLDSTNTMDDFSTNSTNELENEVKLICLSYSRLNKSPNM